MNCVNPPVPGYAYEALRAQVASLEVDLATRTRERDEARAQLARVISAFVECYDLIRNLVRSQHVGDATALRSASRKHAAFYAACTAPPEGGAPDG